jgi:hypothetical protein
LTFDVGNFMAWIGGRSDRADFGWSAATGDAEELDLITAAFRAQAGMTP